MDTQRLKILVVGAGVIGTAYGANLSAAGHLVDVFAQGTRSDDVRDFGLRAIDVKTKKYLKASVNIVNLPSQLDDYDLVLVTVRQEQLASTFLLMNALGGNPTLLFFGNNPGGRALLAKSMPGKVIELGFPGIGGFTLDSVATYMQIPQQPTTLQASASLPTMIFAKSLQHMGFKVTEVINMDGWLLYHALFVSSVAAALYQSDTNALELSRNRPLLKSMCLAISEGFSAMKERGITGLPENLSLLHQPWLLQFAILYWRQVFRSSMGELCFAAHARHARLEMKAIAAIALAAVSGGKHPLKNLEILLHAGMHT